MKNIGENIGSFAVQCIKPGETNPNGRKLVTEKTFEGTWKIIVYYPNDLNYVSQFELKQLNNIAKDLNVPVTVLVGSTSTDFANEVWKLIKSACGSVDVWLFADNDKLKLGFYEKIVKPEIVTCRSLVVIDPFDNVKFLQHDSLDLKKTIIQSFANG